MIDRRKSAFLLGLGILIILVPYAFGATCPPNAQIDGDEIMAGFIHSNIFLCPYSPNEPLVPKCPSGLTIGNFNYIEPEHFPAYYHTDRGLYRNVKDGNVQAPAASDGSIQVKLKVDGLCYQGWEGQYYVWYQVGAVADRLEDPEEGLCYNTAHVVNWDADPGTYCNEQCVGHVVGNQTGLECCGDDDASDSPDGFDCAKSASGGRYVCSQFGTDWEWLDANGQKGQIRELSCSNISVVSTGSDYLKCTNDPSAGAGLSPLTFEYITHDIKDYMYACYDGAGGSKLIAECRGDWGRISSQGTALDSGDSILIDNNTYFCLSDRSGERQVTSFSQNLDDIGKENKLDCTNAKEPDGSAGGYVWTGSKCCAEPEDGDEYYGDREGYNETDPTPGGCWNKNHILAGLPAPGRLLFDTINYKGGFEGCAIDEEDPVLEIMDIHTSEQLINNNQYCSILEDAAGDGAHLFCSFNGNWAATDDSEKSQLKTTLWDDGKGCCNPLQCWDSGLGACINDQAQSSEPTTYHGYRCIAGEWDDSQVLKQTWDSAEAGYCPSLSWCLVNPSQYAPVNCIDSGGYDDKKFCEQGEWTSRTKLVALALLQYASSESPSEYTLFCDTYDNILNFYEYEVGGAVVSNYLGDTQCAGKPCINEMCVLAYPNGVAVGTSVNEPIDSEKSFLKALDQPTDLCENAMSADNQYHQCSGSTIWYNKGHGTIIKLSENDALGIVSWPEAFLAFIKNPFNTIKTWVVPRESDLEFFNHTKMFTKIYADVHGEKKVFAFLEEGKTVDLGGGFMQPGVDYIGLEYQNIGLTPCGLIRKYDSSVSCSSDQTIFAQSRVPHQKNLVDAWPDLTAKLRIR